MLSKKTTPLSRFANAVLTDCGRRQLTLVNGS